LVAWEKPTAASSRRRHAQGLKGFGCRVLGVWYRRDHSTSNFLSALLNFRSATCQEIAAGSKTEYCLQKTTPETQHLKPLRFVFHSHQAYMPRHDSLVEQIEKLIERVTENRQGKHPRIHVRYSESTLRIENKVADPVGAPDHL
jgi:hypothetical protein